MIGGINCSMQNKRGEEDWKIDQERIRVQPGEMVKKIVGRGVSPP